MNYDTLKLAGIDTDGLLKRLMGNGTLVPIFIRKFMEDNTFASLEDAFAQGDMKQAEMASHTLKGMCGNLSMTALFQGFTAQVDLLRRGETEQAGAMMPQLTEDYHTALSYMDQWLKET